MAAMYEIYYKKEIVDKYLYLINSSLYADKIIKLEQLVEENPYKNEMCRPQYDLLNFKYVQLDDEVTIQYYIDEAKKSVTIYLIDIKHEWRNCD